MNIIYGVTLTLKNLLKEIYVGSNKNNLINIQLTSPSDATLGSRNVSLFCYKITENAFSKSQKPLVNNFGEISLPPLIIDLYYLITINVDAISDQATEDVADIQGKILQLFYDNQILSSDKLADELKNKDLHNDENTQLKIRLNTLSMEDLNHLWTLFQSTKFRTSLSYIASPVIIPSERKISTSPVLTKNISYY